MRVAVTKRLLTAICALGLLAAACGGSSGATTVNLSSGTQFVPAVVDSLDNVGVMPSIALNGDGVPFMSYFGFPAELGPNDIPVSRSVYAPYVPSVLMASEDKGIFTRGAVAMAKPPPNLVSIPFGPAVEGSVSSMTPGNVNGTSVVTDSQGGIHVAWVSDTGLWYGAGGGSSSFTVEHVLTLSPKLKTAGSLGWPAVAVDSDGNAWIAYGDATGATQTVDVAVQKGSRWDTQEIASFGPCGGCPEPARVAIGVTTDGPTVAFADASSKTPVAATYDGKKWNPVDIEGGAGGLGLSMAVDSDGAPHVAYYTGDGSVHAASLQGSTWSAKPVGDVGEAKTPRYETTGIAVDDKGTSYVGYYDGGIDSVVLASDTGGDFAALQTPGTAGGAEPAVAVRPDGSEVFLAWYDHLNQDLDLGVLGEANGLELANPSPTTVATAAPPAPSGGGAPPCKSTGTSADLSAPVGAAGTGFDTQCLAIDAGKASVTLDNQDTGVAHNWDLFQDSGYTKSLAATQLTPGPAKETVKLPSLKSGTYYYHCDAHPTTMTGQLYVG